MKVLKWILIIIGILIAGVLIYSATLPSQMKLEESISINAPAGQIYEEVIDFPSWNQWSYWSMLDSAMKQEFSDEMGQVGSYSQWWSENPYVGNGRQEVIEIRENEYLKVEMQFDAQPGKPHAEFILEEQDEGTLVRWTFIGPETPFYSRFMSKLFEPMLRNAYQTSLKNLKELVEAKPPKAVMPDGVELITLNDQMIISILDSTNGEGISKLLTELYTELGIFAETNEEIQISGMPLAIYHNYSPDKVVMEAAMPISGSAKGSGRVMVKALPTGEALKAIHYGDYNASEALHIAISDFIENSEYQYGGSPWEIYANDPTLVDSAEVETHIFYPVSMN